MLATPFTADGSRVDRASLARYVRTVLDRGCSSVVVLGVIGEPASLDAAEKCDVVSTSIESGAPVYVGVMGASEQARATDVEAMRAAFGDRIAGYMVPVGSSDPDRLSAELATLARIGGRPIVLQDYPASSGVHIGVDDLATAMAAVPEVTAVKCEAAPTFSRIRRLRALAPRVRLMSGLGGLSLVDDLSQGATLAATGISRPEMVVEAARAWERGDDREARARIDTIAASVNFEIQQGTSIAIRKEHWRRQGVLASAAVRPPAMTYEAYLQPLSDAYGF